MPSRKATRPKRSPSASATRRAKNQPADTKLQSAWAGRRLRYVLIGLMLALPSVVWITGWGLNSIHFEQAVRSAEQGQLLNNESMLRAALANDPSNVRLLRALALGLFGSERLEETVAVLTQWCELHPDQAEAFKRRMSVNYRRTQSLIAGTERRQLEEQALADGQRAIEIDPTDRGAAQTVVGLCLAHYRYKEAERIYQQCLASQADDPELYYLSARVSHACGDNAEAQRQLERLLAVQPDSTPALMLRAILHYDADEAEQAIPLLRKVIASDVELAKLARNHLAMALARTGQTEEAERIMALVQSENLRFDTGNDTKNLAVRVRRAELMLKEGQSEEALDIVRSVLAEVPEYAAAHRVLADYYQQQGEPVKSAEHRQLADHE